MNQKGAKCNESRLEMQISPSYLKRSYLLVLVILEWKLSKLADLFCNPN